MTPTRQGSFRLFNLAGIDVYLHWSWFLVAAYQLNYRVHGYSSPLWSGLEYLALFVIVLMHEFGHALACRQVGGRANQIVLWPLGGVAYVAPPPRPGATLWSIAAGPLVNVVLAPLLVTAVVGAKSMGWDASAPDVYRFIREVRNINFYLLIFNLLPIYPLDGGQILRSLFWFGLGRAHSLMVASGIGILGVVALILVAIRAGSVWFGILCAFIFMNCWQGLREARALARAARAPRHDGFACPSCQAAPAQLALWVCGSCGNPFDMFAQQGICPHCDARFEGAPCLDCGAVHPISQWVISRTGPPPLSKWDSPKT